MRIWASLFVVTVTLAAGCGDGGSARNTCNLQCDDGNPCNGTETCQNDQCAAGSPVADGTSCATAKVCRAGACVDAQPDAECGNGKVETGEECDDDTAGCSDDCTFVCTDDPGAQCGADAAPACRAFACASDHSCTTVEDPAQDGQACDPAHPEAVCKQGACAVCGNGVRDQDEDCDDGNRSNLDGCDAACKIEQAARITALQQQFAPDAFCTRNKLGQAITADARDLIQATWDAPILDGSMSIVFKFLGLPGVLGPDTDTDFELGFVNASPVRPDPDNDGYDGTSDLDWWYLREPVSVDADEVPTVRLPGHISQGHLTAGPGTISLKLLFALAPAQVTLFKAVVDAQIDPDVDAPLSAEGALPRGHLMTEHVDPMLKTFKTSSGGAMCSDVSVQSLVNTPIPPLLQGTCTKAGSDSETVFDLERNSLLDVFIVGCNVFGLRGIVPTQPDGGVDGATYRFTFNTTTFKVAACTRNGVRTPLATCLANATYSSSFKFQSDRVIIHRE